VPISADASYGLGWIVGEYKGLQLLTHGGNTIGFSSDLAFIPSANVGIVVLTNQRQSLMPSAVVNYFAEIVFAQDHESDVSLDFAIEQQQENIADALSHLTDLDVEAITPYLGTFHNDTLGDIVLTYTDDKLTLDAGEFAVELRSFETDSGETRYVSISPAWDFGFNFTEDDAGDPTIVLGAGLVEYTFTPVRSI